MTYDEFPELENDVYRPSYGFSNNVKSNVINIQFNNGYQQIVPIGKNYKTNERTASWNNLRWNFTDNPENDEEGNIVYKFLYDHVDVKPFWFRKLPNEEKVLVLASELTYSHNEFDLVSISCKLTDYKGFGDING